MNDDEEQNQDEENTEESPDGNVENEENTDENSDVDIDNSEETSEEEQYQIELEKWFAELEKLHGVPFANDMRKKILLDKQIANELDVQAWAKFYNEQALERLQIIQEQNDATFEQTQKLIQQSADLNAKSYARFCKFLDDSETRDKALEQKLSDLMELKRKKLAKEVGLKMQLLKAHKTGVDS
jgi:hypothetical protein